MDFVALNVLLFTKTDMKVLFNNPWPFISLNNIKNLQKIDKKSIILFLEPFKIARFRYNCFFLFTQTLNSIKWHKFCIYLPNSI